jgi:DNA-binding NtrC family response regulator
MSNKKNIRVLIVDDEERFRTTFSANLQKRGFDVSAVEGGAEALKEIRDKEFDVVVLDVKMPGMDGNETLSRMKMLRPGLEVIMLTGHGSIRSALEGYRDHVYAYLMKPCDIDVLSEKIRDAAAKKKGIDDFLWHSVANAPGPLG